MDTKDPDEKNILKEDKGAEESPLAHVDEETEEQTTASPAVSHTEPYLVYDNITGEQADKKWSESKFLCIHNTFIRSE